MFPTISLQRSIDHTTQWAACWHGKFSSCKTELLLIGRQTSADDQGSISIYSSVIAECSSHKHLGVTISSNLNWSAHVTQLIKKASRRCGLLRCMSHHLPPTISSLLYIYHVRPIFEYASPLWHGAISAELALSLEKLQASVARAILRAPWRTPKQQLLKALKGKLHSKIISSDMKDFFRRIQWWRSEVKIRTGRRSNRRSKMAEKSRVTTPHGRHESWCQASAVRGCVPILINPEFDAALDRDSCVTH